MGKVLRILVILILILSIVSLVFAHLLFVKREVLIKRNSIFEDTVVKLAKTIEQDDAEDSAPPTVEEDISEVTERELVNPEKQSMLKGYPISLEQQNMPCIDLDNNKMRGQLRSLYKIGPDGKPEIDTLSQKPAMKGPGTMQDTLDDVVERAKVQQAKLNKTRSELKKMRAKMMAAVEEVNSLKIEGRASKFAIKEKRDQIATLESEKADLETKVAKLTAEKKELNAELADTRNEVEKLNEAKLNLEEDLAAAKKDALEWKKRYEGGLQKHGDGTATVYAGGISAGVKGKVLAANDELKFAILELSNDAMKELLGPKREGKLPQLELNVRRKGRQSASGEFVTRVQLRQAVRGKNLIVADILADWQQTAVEKGDVVFF